MNLVMDYLKGEWKRWGGDGSGDVFDKKNEWSMINLGTRVPQQKNCSDCGMFTCTFATWESDVLVRGGFGLPLGSFSQNEMPYLRQRLALCVLLGRID